MPALRVMRTPNSELQALAEQLPAGAGARCCVCVYPSDRRSEERRPWIRGPWCSRPKNGQVRVCKLEFAYLLSHAGELEMEMGDWEPGVTEQHPCRAPGVISAVPLAEEAPHH